MPKMKTHHWTGATLSMKNLFGVVPGGVYGWPKNVLHWAGIHECIADLHALFPRQFAIVDGIVGMEGNGPIQGTPKLPACWWPEAIRLQSTRPAAASCRSIRSRSATFGWPPRAGPESHVLERNIRQIGEPVAAVATPFELPPDLLNFRLERGRDGVRCSGLRRRDAAA